MFKTIAIATTILISSAVSASAFEVCQPKVDTDVSVSNGEPKFSIGLDFVVGKANCDKVRAIAAADEAKALKEYAAIKTEEAKAVKIELETTEQAIDNLLKNIKAFDALTELCSETGNANICAKADNLAHMINQ